MAAQKKQREPFLVERKEIVVVKPSEPTPSDILSLSTIDNDINLELICQSIYVYQANEMQSDDLDPASVIKAALSRVLVYYYPLAGKLKREDDGRLRVTCNADGVPFLEATCNSKLSTFNFFDGIDVETAKEFVFDSQIDNKNGYSPLVLLVTKFSCGGFTIGMGLSHSVCDGFGAAQFFRALAVLASGMTEPSVKPVWDRQRLVGTASQDPVQLPVDMASLSSSPFLPPTQILHECFHVDAEAIGKLKSRLMKETDQNGVLNEGFTFTTIEVLSAYIWRSRFRALKLNPDGNNIFLLTMGLRQLIMNDPPLPEGYYGNACIPSIVVLLGKDLDGGPLSKVAKMIKESKKIHCVSKFVRLHLNLLETVLQQKMKRESRGASLVLTDWRHLKLLEEVDFGWKACVNVVPLPMNMFGCVDLCIFLPPPTIDSSMKGGVRVLVSLPAPAMPKFKEEMDALKIESE